jgi:hypothetical protein
MPKTEKSRQHQNLKKMKKQIVLMAFTAMCISVQLKAQQSSAKEASKSRSNIQNNKSCIVKIEPIEEGCAISFDFLLKLSRDAGSGQATGKRPHKPLYIVRASDNSVTEAKNPGVLSSSRSSNSSKATMQGVSASFACSKSGKISVVDGEFTLPADCPDGDHDLILAWSWGASNSGSNPPPAGSGSGRCVVTFTVTMQDGACHAISTKGTGTSG